jgi:hypothetical protein
MSSGGFRKVALALPGTGEGAHQGHGDFSWGMVKLTPEQQAVRVDAEPEIFRPVPGGWGKHGNTHVRLARADATTLHSALTMAWKNVAPKSPASPRGKKKP